MEDLELKRLEIIARVNERLIAFSNHYQNLIFGMIYTGFFALWFSVRDDINKTAMLAAGMFMLISISVYGFWLVFSSNLILKKEALALEQLRNATNLKKQQDLEMASDIAEENAKIFKYQPTVFYVSVVTGLIAISFLLFGFIHELWHQF